MKSKALKTVGIAIAVILSFVTYIRYERNKEIEDLKVKSQFLIQQVEQYKKQHHKLPRYETDMKLNLPDDYPISYAMWDSTTYVVGFEIAPFRSMVYHSDTKTWIPQQ